jgi:hypothetical protein
MDAKRLEALVYRCNEAIEDTGNGFGAYFDASDIADLARCAAAWAKVERAKEHTGNHTWCIVSDRHGFTLDTAWGGEYDPKLTAIAAVEAAQEVTDANKG